MGRKGRRQHIKAIDGGKDILAQFVTARDASRPERLKAQASAAMPQPTKVMDKRTAIKDQEL